MLVYSDAIDTNYDFHLYCGHFVAFDLWWNIIAGIRACHRMDNIVLRCSSNTAVDADRNVEELGIVVWTGIDENEVKLHYTKYFMKT